MDPVVRKAEKAAVLQYLGRNIPLLKPVFDFARSLKIKSKDNARSFGFEVFEGRPGLYFQARF